MKRILVIALALIMTFTFTVPFALMADAEQPAYAFYDFDSYKDLIQGLTDSSSVSFSTLMTDCTTVCKDTLTAFAKGEIKIRIPTINGEPAPLRNKDGFSSITFFASELYNLPWTWYDCKVGEYDLRINISYLDALDNEQLREAVSYTDVLDIIAPDAPSPSNYQDYESYKSIYEKDMTLYNGKTVKAMICELKESSNVHVMIHIDGVLMILYGDNSLLADSFFESLDLVAAEDAIKGDVNMDGGFDSLDYVLLKRVYFGTYPEEKLNCTRGDLNGNGQIDSMDYVLLKRAYFGTYEIK